MSRERPRGRRPKSQGDTRGTILSTAGQLFARGGLETVSIREIAREANVDPALVLHYFESKERLFFESLSGRMRSIMELSLAAPGSTSGLGERVVDTFLAHWDAADGGGTFAALFRTAMTNDRAMQMLRQFIQTEIPRTLARRIPGMADPTRIGLAATQLMGLAVARYVTRIEPVVRARRADLVRAVGPTIDRYLIGELGERTKKA